MKCCGKGRARCPWQVPEEPGTLTRVRVALQGCPCCWPQACSVSGHKAAGPATQLPRFFVHNRAGRAPTREQAIEQRAESEESGSPGSRRPGHIRAAIRRTPSRSGLWASAPGCRLHCWPGWTRLTLSCAQRREGESPVTIDQLPTKRTLASVISPKDALEMH